MKQMQTTEENFKIELKYPLEKPVGPHDAGIKVLF